MAQITTFDGNNIYTETHGSGDTTLLFIHGWNLTHEFWDDQVAEFSADYRVVTMDLPGYGKSDKDRSSWTMENYGKDVNQVIHQLDLKNVILVAHSMGGNIALEALRMNDGSIIGLIGVDNFKQVGATPPPEEEEQVEMFLAMLREDYPVNVRLSSEGFMFAPDSPAEPKERVLAQYAAADPKVAIPVVSAVFEAGKDEAMLLEKVSVPFAVISAEYIPFMQEGIDKHYKGPAFHVYKMTGSGHFPMVERPEMFNRLLREALVNLR
jgi:pimeloyl-ACP methyl ester carboxylesterase